MHVTLERAEGTRTGAVLLEKARIFDADLLVIGAYGHAKITEVVFGGVTRTVLKNADLPVLMSM